MTPTTPTPSPSPVDPESSGDLVTVLDEMQGLIGGMGGTLLIMIGAISIVWAGVLLIKKLMSPDSYGSSWGSILVMLIMGGAMSSGGLTLISGTGSDPEAEQRPKNLDGSGGATQSPTPEATDPPSPQPTSDPIALPEISNPGALWTLIGIAAAVIALLVVLYLFAQKVQRDRIRRVQEENERLEAEAEAQHLAEEKAAREKAAAEKKARIEARWATITDLHAALKGKVAQAETDWDTLFDLPALSDVSYRQTRALHRAMREAENAVAPMPPGFDEHTVMDRIPYVKKVHAFEDAWAAAMANAKKVGTSKLPTEELKTIRRIRRLLLMAEGNGASANERHTAYTQIRKLLGDLSVVQVPQRTLLAVEANQRLALTGGPAADARAAAEAVDPVRVV